MGDEIVGDCTGERGEGEPTWDKLSVEGGRVSVVSIRCGDSVGVDRILEGFGDRRGSDSWFVIDVGNGNREFFDGRGLVDISRRDDNVVLSNVGIGWIA